MNSILKLNFQKLKIEYNPISKFTIYFKICLPSYDWYDYAGVTGVLTGWGITSDASQSYPLRYFYPRSNIGYTFQFQ